LAAIWGLVSTASAALQNREDISKSTRQRIQGVADELGYQHDSIVRSLVACRSNILGVIVPDLSRSFFLNCSGVDSIASEQGYSLLVCNTGEDAEKEDRILSMLESRRGDGLSIASHAVCKSGIGKSP
jgi:LacI family transcriptional regulator